MIRIAFNVDDLTTTGMDNQSTADGTVRTNGGGLFGILDCQWLGIG
jgi:hypothetical protein